MRTGLYLRNMGPSSDPETILACARAADQSGIDDLWLADHVAIPPDDAEGSNGRYLDPLATSAWILAATERIHVGTGVLVLPYRPTLATTKWVATIQELSGGRFLFGVGAGWMEPEFKAVGVPKSSRGKVTDQILRFVHEAFANDEVTLNGQTFLFRPRPTRPPIIVGGGGAAVFRRIVRYGDGWMPMGLAPDKMGPAVEKLTAQMKDAGRPAPDVVAITGLPLGDVPAAIDVARTYRDAGATRLVHASRYADAAEFARDARIFAEEVAPAI